MKFLFDAFPIVLFFVAYKLGNIFIATAVAIVAGILQVFWSRYRVGRFEKLPLFTLATIVILGGATLIFRNELFIKWKPTALYWLLSVIFLVSHFFGQKRLLQRAMEQHIQLTPKAWFQLNLSWVVFFFLMGMLNLYVVYHFDTDTWVNFKLFGTMGLTLLFIIAQGIYMSKLQKNSLEREK